MIFCQSSRPEFSAWGPIQSGTQLLPGVWKVSTASHGGLILSHERQEAMPEPLLRPDASYDEHIAWGQVFIAFEAEFRDAGLPLIDIEMQLAHDTVRTYHPLAYASFTGVAIEPRDSHVLRKIAAYKAVIGKHVVTAAWGDWADWVPSGKVGVEACIVSSVDHLGFASYDRVSEVRALADATLYRSGGDVVTLASLDADPC